jgi:uncharacterized protein (TIGR02996 family)
MTTYEAEEEIREGPAPGEEEAFWAAIEARPEDHLPRLVFADWLDERGRQGEATAWRETVGFAPRRFYTLNVVAWHDASVFTNGAPDDLPRRVFRRIVKDPKNKQTAVYFDSFREAMEALFDVWREEG